MDAGQEEGGRIRGGAYLLFVPIAPLPFISPTRPPPLLSLRAQLVARSLAAMPARIAAWRLEKEQMREKSRQDAARRQRLLAEAAERLGTPVRPGDPRVQALMQDLERERRRQEKKQRRQRHEEATRSALAAAEAAAASQPPPGGSETPQ